MIILNLGCGTQVSAAPEIVNLDWSIYLRLRRNPVLRWLTPWMVSGERLRKFQSLPDNIVVHDLARGIPFPSQSVEAVYHSHVLEHLDRCTARHCVEEVRRVLKPGGIHRIAVPDLERACRRYLAHLDGGAASDPQQHDRFVAAMIEQSVRREAVGTSQQPPFRRWVENRVLGDARQQGDTHQWMYDRMNLSALLLTTGHREIAVTSFSRSRIPNWPSYGLEVDQHGGEYKPGSLYMEATV